MNILRLSQRGIAHYIIPMVVAVAVAIGGVLWVAIDHADPTIPSYWQSVPATYANTNETGVKFYACIDRVSSSKWVLKGLAVMSRSVKDASSYSFQIQAMSSKKGSGQAVTSTWGTYVTPLSARASLQFVPSNTTILEVLDSPKAHPLISGNTGNPISASSVSKC